MTEVIIVVEDDLSEAILRKIIASANPTIKITRCLRGEGAGYIKKRSATFAEIAKNVCPVVILTDLDSLPCPSVLLERWQVVPSKSFIFRIAIKEVEAWLMADWEAFSTFIGHSKLRAPETVDTIDCPKEHLIGLVKRYGSRPIKDAIVPRIGSTAKVGPDYNAPLVDFVHKNWSAKKARVLSESLNRAYKAIGSLSA